MIGLFLLALTGASPNLETCVGQIGRSPEVTRLKAALASQVAEGRLLAPADEQQLRRLRSEGAACGRRQAVGPEREAAFGDLVIAGIAADAMRARLAAERIDPVKVDARLRSADPAVLDALIAKNMAHPEVAHLARELIDGAGGPRTTAAQRRLLGGYAINAARRIRGLRP